MNKRLLNRILIGIGAVLVIWFLVIQKGGDTITILNRSGHDICEVYFAYQPEVNGWGKNHLGAYIRRTHSRDIRLPIYFEWSAGDLQEGYSGRLVDCDGNELAVMDGIGVDTNFYIWEVR